MNTRRDLFRMALAGSAAVPASALGLLSASAAAPEGKGQATGWAQGIEGQRKADLGDGTFLNPILAGDHPDPSILKDGDDYYMTHSSFEASPGLLIWHSRDLVNWTPICTALEKPPGMVFAVDLVKHKDRYYIYIPFLKVPWATTLPAPMCIYVMHAPSITGPWSAPIDLGLRGMIDPGHLVGEDGNRYLFLSGIKRVRLSEDGLSTVGPVEKVYDGWHYPDDWITEAYALEGPKLLRRGDWFYLISAVGGTAGPPTGHMVIAARSRSVHGPWENCPHNPIVRTTDPDERWLSRGHATLVCGPGEQWFMVYHGYENGYRTLGRQTLLEPIEWTSDGWFKATGGDLAQPLRKPVNLPSAPHGVARSDNFSQASFGSRWSFYAGGPNEIERASLSKDGLVLRGKGTGPHDCSPLTQMVGDHAYEISVTLALQGDAEAGLLLFFNDRLFLGVGVNGERMKTFNGGKVSHWREPAPPTKRIHLRISNDRHIITYYYSLNGTDWTRHGVRAEASGYHANTIGDLASLRPALYVAGSGTATFSDFRYRAL
ncbi:family 43 glycosylhydrolase [Niveispirillum sp. BGYR6]|uniref:family 43 glycosylhydrolase n=1 Tax=Niveispirillum sp. BGYR6 TaxID=2971249 RepID=UPI0022B9CCD3|nr:family 43 glycosylhydrolase [Niveispirillum sp. BGYR6]MDG5497334.1 family 43 glycosylhydrolase [Niveispirillum sp. BGYR6]